MPADLLPYKKVHGYAQKGDVYIPFCEADREKKVEMRIVILERDSVGGNPAERAQRETYL